jgi:hypothetical protein
MQYGALLREQLDRVENVDGSLAHLLMTGQDASGAPSPSNLRLRRVFVPPRRLTACDRPAD